MPLVDTSNHGLTVFSAETEAPSRQGYRPAYAGFRRVAPDRFPDAAQDTLARRGWFEVKRVQGPRVEQC